MITLKCQAKDGSPLEATFFPEKGMNLVSFKKGNVEVIDPSTKNLFEERFAGLGALIGPHFHHRHPAAIPPIKDESLFPHIARVRAQGIQEPFSHGIARYAPWTVQSTVQSTDQKITARITGKDTWNGVPLAALEGQNFSMEMTAWLNEAGLRLTLSVVSDTDSLVGIHYYYRLMGNATVSSQVQKKYRKEGVLQDLPLEWNIDSQQLLKFDLSQSADYTFYPFPNPCRGSILLDAGDYRLLTTYTSPSQENCWQLYHPEGASYACIEPISAQDPRHPNLSVSKLEINLEIQDHNSGN